MKTERKEFCFKCKFWEGDKTADALDCEGECHRFPPKAEVNHDSEKGNIATAWFPPSWANDWCGEFQED